MNTPRGHVVLLATGGTISSGPDGRLGAQSLIRLAASGPESIPAGIPVRGENITCVPSSRMTTESIKSLAAKIRNSLAQPDCVGAVVTHGTDTLEEVAFACDLLVDSVVKPIVFTGAMIPPKDKGTDAHSNLARAIRVAGASPPPCTGVLVVMRQGIHTPIDVRKCSTTSIDAFASPQCGPIGWVHADQIELVRKPTRLDITTDRLEPAVNLITLTAGGGDTLIRAVLPTSRGLVIELFGAGNAPESVQDAIRDAVAAGVVVVVCSRVGLGGLAPESGVIEAGALATDLDGLKARVLLMAALGAGLDASGIQSLVNAANRSRG